MVPNPLTAKSIRTTAMAMSMGHASSAYSLPWVNPSGSVRAAETMIACHHQKGRVESVFENIGAFISRCIE